MMIPMAPKPFFAFSLFLARLALRGGQKNSATSVLKNPESRLGGRPEASSAITWNLPSYNHVQHSRSILCPRPDIFGLLTHHKTVTWWSPPSPMSSKLPEMKRTRKIDSRHIGDWHFNDLDTFYWDSNEGTANITVRGPLFWQIAIYITFILSI